MDVSFLSLASRSNLNESDLRYSQVSFSNPLDCAWLYNPDHPPNARSIDYTDSSLLDSAVDSPSGSETMRSGPRKRPATPMQRCRPQDEESEDEQAAHLERSALTSGEQEDDESALSSPDEPGKQQQIIHSNISEASV